MRNVFEAILKYGHDEDFDPLEKDEFEPTDLGTCGEPYTPLAACALSTGQIVHGIWGFDALFGVLAVAAFAIFLATLLGCNLVGEGLRDALDPRRRAS